MVNNLTWRCHICREERPDERISVFKHHRTLQDVSFTENVRFCNDREECLDGAANHKGFVMGVDR